jgi:type I restriction enzyme S subunit
MTDGKYVEKTERKVTAEGLEKGRLVPKDSVLVTCIASIGKMALAFEDCLTNQQINTIICRKEVNPHYVYYAIGFRSNILKNWAGRTTSPIVKKSMFEKFPIPVPRSYFEQAKIAEVLSCVDLAIQRTCEVIAKTERLKKGLMQKLLTEGMGHKEFKDTEIGKIPATWEVRKVGEVLELCQYGLSLRFGDQGKYPIVKMDDIVNGVVVPDNVRYVDLDAKTFGNFRLEKGDVLFNRTNSFELVGRTGIFLLNGDYVFASYLIRLRPKKGTIGSQYLTYYMIFSNERLKQLATRAVHQANINATNLQSFKIPVPPSAEQQRIAETLSCMDSKLELEKKQRAKLERIKQGLMDLLLSGKVRVRVD